MFLAFIRARKHRGFVRALTDSGCPRNFYPDALTRQIISSNYTVAVALAKASGTRNPVAINAAWKTLLKADFKLLSMNATYATLSHDPNVGYDGAFEAIATFIHTKPDYFDELENINPKTHSHLLDRYEVPNHLAALKPFLDGSWPFH